MANIAPSSSLLGVANKTPTQGASTTRSSSEFGGIFASATSTEALVGGYEGVNHSVAINRIGDGNSLPNGQQLATSAQDGIEQTLDATTEETESLLQQLGRANNALTGNEVGDETAPLTSDETVFTDEVLPLVIDSEEPVVVANSVSTTVEQTKAELLAQASQTQAQLVAGQQVTHSDALMDKQGVVVGTPIDPAVANLGGDKVAVTTGMMPPTDAVAHGVTVERKGDSIELGGVKVTTTPEPLLGVATAEPVGRSLPEVPLANSTLSSNNGNADAATTLATKLTAETAAAATSNTASNTTASTTANTTMATATVISSGIADGTEASVDDGAKSTKLASQLTQQLTPNSTDVAVQVKAAGTEALIATQTSITAANAIEAEASLATRQLTMQGVSSQVQTATTQANTIEAQLRQPMDSSKLVPEMQNRLQAMINSDKLTAELRLDPPELGAMRVRIQMNGDQANVQIVTQQGQAREMLEQALPRLRDMLQQQGLQLGQTDISQHQSGQQPGTQSGGDGTSMGRFESGSGEELFDNEADAVMLTNRTSDGGIDYYA